jgi:hypothetical protein
LSLLHIEYGNIPIYYTCMVNSSTYQEALSKLNYIEHAKAKLCDAFSWLTSFEQSHMFIKARDFDYAKRSIHEILDELFYEEAQEACLHIEAFERNKDLFR